MISRRWEDLTDWSVWLFAIPVLAAWWWWDRHTEKKLGRKLTLVELAVRRMIVAFVFLAIAVGIGGVAYLWRQ